MTQKNARSKVLAKRSPGDPNEAQQARLQRKLEALRAFLRSHPAGGLSANLVYRGVPLGRFARSTRHRHREGGLSPWLTAALEAISGWTWEPRRSPGDAMPNVKRLRAYVEAHGWAGVSGSTVIEGSPIGRWIVNCRSAYRKGWLSENLKAALEDIPGWTWESASTRDPYPNVTRLKSYVDEHGWDGINTATVIDGSPVGRWITNVRAEHRRGTLSRGLTAALKRIPGWTWDTQSDVRLRRVLDAIGETVRRHGWSAITRDTVVEGVQVDLWFRQRRKEHRQGRLAPWLIAGLKAIPGWRWTAEAGRYQRRDMATLLAECVARDGWDDITWETTFRGARVGGFLQECLFRRVERRLAPTLAKRLESIPGWRWDRDVAANADRRILGELKEHLKTEGWRRLREWTKFQETKLGRWLRFCRSRWKREALPDWLRRSLESIAGWTWDFKASKRAGRAAQA